MTGVQTCALPISGISSDFLQLEKDAFSAQYSEIVNSYGNQSQQKVDIKAIFGSLLVLTAALVLINAPTWRIVQQFQGIAQELGSDGDTVELALNRIEEL